MMTRKVRNSVSVAENADSAEKSVATLGVQQMLDRARSLKNSELSRQILTAAEATASVAQMEGQITPEVKETLADLVLSIENVIEQAIRSDFTAHQSALNTSVDLLDSLTDNVVAGRTDGTAHDTTYNNCIRDEDDMLSDLHYCLEELVNATEDAEAACGVSNSSRYKTYTISTPTLSCDFEGPGDCSSNFAAWQTEIQTLMDYVEGNTTADNAAHDAEQDVCNEKSDDKHEKDAECTGSSGLESQWYRKMAVCEHQDATRQLAICSWGFMYQDQCQEKANYIALVSDSYAVQGTNKSEVDRRAEWSTIQLLKCVINNYVDETYDDIGIDNFNYCSNLPDTYDTEIGTFNNRSTTFDASMAKTDYDDCEQLEHEFAGSTWAITPEDIEDRKLNNTEYLLVSPKSYTVDLVFGNRPFDFCLTSGDLETCGEANFNCSAYGKTSLPAGTTCYIECSDTVCCEGPPTPSPTASPTASPTTG